MPDLQPSLMHSWPLDAWSDVPVVVAVSGGADSVALLRALHAVTQPKPGYLLVAHFNHRVRGPAADADEAFVRQLGWTLGIPCFVGYATAAASDPSAAHQERNAGSAGSEAAWRDVRYAFLADVAQRHGARYVAMAHTRDDQVETILHRLIRGSGLAGLAGIPRTRSLAPGVSLIRPMLDVSRADVLEYLDQIGQPFRTDASNQDSRFTRNRLRNELLPLLSREYNPAVAESLLRLGVIAGETSELISGLAADVLERCLVPGRTGAVTLLAAPLLAAPPPIARELFVLVWKRQNWPLRDMSYERWCALHDFACRAPVGNRFTAPGGIVARRHTDQLVLTAPDPPSDAEPP